MKKLTKKKIKEIMKSTCWGGLSFCCSLEKPCPDRDRVLRLLGITRKEFTNLKKKFDEELFKLVGSKNV